MLLLDREYSAGFVWAAYKAGWVDLTDLGKKTLRDLGMDYFRELLRPRQASRYSQRALELAAIYDKIVLYGLPAGDLFDLTRLAAEGALLRAIPLASVLVDAPCTAVQLDLRLAAIGRRLEQECIATSEWLRKLHRLESRSLTKDDISIILDVFFGFMEDENIDTLLKLKSFYNSFRLLPKSRRASPVPKQFEPHLYWLYEYTKLHPQLVIYVLLDLIARAVDVLTLDLLSAHSECVYASALVSMPPRPKSLLPEPDQMLSAYKLCAVAMNDIVRHAPEVKNVGDLLRMRKDARVKSFRRALDRWAKGLREQSAAVIGEMREEIRRRNKELERLSALTKVERWLYWTSVPLAFVPVLSTIHTVIAFGAQFERERRQKSNWIALGL